MKGLFPQYDDPTTKDFAGIWKQALFVFDTNVLLNLYRYQAATRDELLNVLGQLTNRVWIPHHVALEFQRNRLKVIAEQSKRFSEVRRTIEKSRSSLFADIEKLQLQKRHSLINPEPLFADFEKMIEGFLTELNRLQESQQKVTDPDPLKTKIELVFDGRVGSPPSDQDAVDELYKEAELRFKLKIPPGFQDSEKDKDGPDEHIHGGIVYKRKYGDFVVWHQLLGHAKQSKSGAVVFVTDDGKDDWWQKVDSDGPKTIGPRPELIEEAATRGDIKSFLMYNPEGFLKYAKEFLKAQVSEETLKEVRDVSRTASLSGVGFREFREYASRAEDAVMRWLFTRYSNVEQNRYGFPDFIAESGGKTSGYEVKVISNTRIALHLLRDTVYRAYYALKENGFAEITIVWVVSDSEQVAELKRMIQRAAKDAMPENLRIVIGVYYDDDDSETGFEPYDSFSYAEANQSMQRTVFGRR